MRFFFRVIIILLMITCYYVMMNDKMTNYNRQTKDNLFVSESKKSLQLKTNYVSERVDEHLSLSQMIHQRAEDLMDEFGEPFRKDLTPYGYIWWVYHHEGSYYQFGINEEDTIETIYARNIDIPLAGLEHIYNYDEVKEQLAFKNTIHFQDELSSYTFNLTNEDIKYRPLVHIDEDVFMQLYFDQFTHELSSLRILTADILLKHIPYEVQYRGKLPEKPNLTDDQWGEIDRGMEQQIFDVTNLIRETHHLEPLQWEQILHEVAYHHSRDMAANNYFSHTSPNGSGLKERLAHTEINYQAAGENIAAHYPDALGAIEGWLNSEGHREALLAEEFTHLGVGVYRLFYTQNFITIP